MLSRNKTVAACKGLAVFLGRFLRKPQDEVIGAIPSLNHIQPFINLLPERF